MQFSCQPTRAVQRQCQSLMPRGELGWCRQRELLIVACLMCFATRAGCWQGLAYMELYGTLISVQKEQFSKCLSVCRRAPDSSSAALLSELGAPAEISPVLWYFSAFPAGVFELSQAPLPSSAPFPALTWFSKESPHRAPLKPSLHGHTHTEHVYGHKICYLLWILQRHI